MRKPFASQVSEHLQMAFDKVEEGVEKKLDALKQAYNETARSLSEIDPELLKNATTPVPAPPNDPPPVVKPPPLPTIYSIPTPLKSERPIPLRPRIPRPVPKVPQAPAVPQSGIVMENRRVSGRFYVQLARSEDGDAFNDVRERVGKLGRIVDSGRGCASDPEAAWVEIAVRGDAGDLVAGLSKVELKELVEKVIEVKPGEGRLLARQLDVFRIQNSEKK